MLKILTVIFSVSVLQVRLHVLLMNHYPNMHLINMTESLCKDAMYKLRMADFVQSTYKDTYGYELGIIAAGLMVKFKRMIKIYRYYSNAKSFKTNEHSLQDVMNAYSVMQSEYNEMVHETVLYYKVLEGHLEKDTKDYVKSKVLAKKYGMSAAALMALNKRGIKLSDYGLSRRAMQTETKLPEYVGKLPEVQENRPRRLLLEDPMSKNINIWTPKKDNNTKEEEYKKKLRYTVWAEKWKGFDGETEGVNIADTIARLGLTNDSDFLLRELKGAV